MELTLPQIQFGFFIRFLLYECETDLLFMCEEYYRSIIFIGGNTNFYRRTLIMLPNTIYTLFSELNLF